MSESLANQNKDAPPASSMQHNSIRPDTSEFNRPDTSIRPVTSIRPDISESDRPDTFIRPGTSIRPDLEEGYELPERVPPSPRPGDPEIGPSTPEPIGRTAVINMNITTGMMHEDQTSTVEGLERIMERYQTSPVDDENLLIVLIEDTSDRDYGEDREEVLGFPIRLEQIFGLV